MRGGEGDSLSSLLVEGGINLFASRRSYRNSSCLHLIKKCERFRKREADRNFTAMKGRYNVTVNKIQ